MSLVVDAECLGCGACEPVCPQGAISQSEGYLVVYEIDPLACNDCMECIEVCAVDALVEDPDFAVCLGRGCPLSSKRLSGFDCSQGRQRCGDCGAMLWRSPVDSDWACPRCDMGKKVICPKVRTTQAVQEPV